MITFTPAGPRDRRRRVEGLGDRRGWDAHVAGATVAVAAVGILIAVVLGLGAVVNGSGIIPSGVIGANYGF